MVKFLKIDNIEQWSEYGAIETPTLLMGVYIDTIVWKTGITY